MWEMHAFLIFMICSIILIEPVMLAKMVLPELILTYFSLFKIWGDYICLFFKKILLHSTNKYGSFVRHTVW